MIEDGFREVFVDLAYRAFPQEFSWMRLNKKPATQMLQAMAAQAQRAEIIGAGATTLGPGQGVVDLTMLRGARTTRADTGVVANLDVFGEGGGWAVGAAVEVGEHR